MESWSYASEGKSFSFSDEIDIPVDAFVRSRKASMEWDTKSSCDFENNGFVSDKVAIESMELKELGFPETIRKPFLSNPGVGISGGEVSHYSDRRVIVSPTCMIPSNPSFGEEELGLKFLGSPVESYSQESSLIDLKLGRLDDSKDAQNNKLLKEYPNLSSLGSHLPAKRCRTTSSNSQTPFCQVLGCNMDLSSSKDYHKRHRVCDVHSKTAKVIVNGIEQRFCQQCSRFHLVAEFDDCKRSCRKRLTGHNARRRKPQLDTLYSRPNKFLEPYQGTAFQGTSLPKRSSFVFSDLDKYEQANRGRHVKLEESIYSPQPDTPMTNSLLFAKSFSSIHDSGKQHSSRIPFGTAPNVQDLSGASNSSCAFSLLSAQSQEFQSNTAGTPKASSLIIPSVYAHQSVGHVSEKHSRASSMKKFAANGFWSSDMNSTEVYYQKGSIMLSDASHAVDFEDHADRMFQGSEILDVKYCLSPEHGTTVDLIQLSSHLQRIEQQKDSLQG